MAVMVGKDSQVRLLDADHLNNGAGMGHGGELQKLSLPQGNVVTSQRRRVDQSGRRLAVGVHRERQRHRRVPADCRGGRSVLTKRWPASGNGSAGTSPVVANGIVYYMSGSQILALDAQSGSPVVTAGPWMAGANANGGTHWQSMILVNGRVYAIDNSSPSKFWVYALDGVFKNGFN